MLLARAGSLTVEHHVGDGTEEILGLVHEPFIIITRNVLFKFIHVHMYIILTSNHTRKHTHTHTLGNLDFTHVIQLKDQLSLSRGYLEINEISNDITYMYPLQTPVNINSTHAVQLHHITMQYYQCMHVEWP